MTYIVFILQCQKAQKNCQILYRIETSIVLIVSDGVLCDVSALYCMLPFLTIAQHESGSRKTISWSVAV